MQDILKIENRALDGAQIQTINARDLHAFLEIGKDFSNWIKAQIERARLVQDRDFVKETSIAQKGDSGNQRLSGKEKVEYHLTLDAAKHIGMMSGTEKGFEVRDYFIECERRAKQAAQSLSPVELFALQAQINLDVERRQKAIQAAQEKILEAQDRIATRQDATEIVAAQAVELASIAEAKAQATAMACMDYSIMAYARLNDVSITLADAQRLGQSCAAISRERGYPIGKARDPRFGKVNTYIETVLNEVFEQYYAELDL
jgi:phage anti-repressor protein